MIRAVDACPIDFSARARAQGDRSTVYSRRTSQSRAEIGWQQSVSQSVPRSDRDAQAKHDEHLVLQ